FRNKCASLNVSLLLVFFDFEEIRRGEIYEIEPTKGASFVMDEMCMVMCGAWVCGSDGKWEFVVDKTNMERIIPVHEAMTIHDLEGRVFAEFKKAETSFNVALSYWPPDSKALATGIKTPQSSSQAIVRLVSRTLNLFATFDNVGYATAAADCDGFETPRCSTNQRKTSAKRKAVDLSSVGSKTNFINFDDFQLVEEVEKFEERLRSESNRTGGGDCSGWSDCIDSDYSGPEEIDERDVRPRGYDVEFWEPLIVSDKGGSNSVEVVFNDKEANGVAKVEEGSRSDRTYSNSTFDRMVHPVWESSGGGSNAKGENPMDDFAPIGDLRDEDIPEDVKNKMLMPPLTKRPPGRRRTKRFPSTGEMPVDWVLEIVISIIYERVCLISAGGARWKDTTGLIALDVNATDGVSKNHLGYGCGLHASGWAVGCCGYMGVGVDMMELGCDSFDEGLLWL
ncbi:LOW QUALITY PROTEIN: hypothetical protein HID58_056733, partial [Brassica napus]